MRILCISDFHGRAPKGLKLRIKKEKIDAIFCTGDIGGSDKIRKILFSTWTKKPWFEVVGIKKAEKMLKESFESGIKILKFLNSLDLPVYLVLGNDDFCKEEKIKSKTFFKKRKSKSKKKDAKIYPKDPGYYDDVIPKLKNIVHIQDKITTLDKTDIMLAGYGQYMTPTVFLKESTLKKGKKTLARIKKNYIKTEKKVLKLFSKIKNPSKKKIIFLTHAPPYLTRFDRIINPSSPMDGRHIGVKSLSKIDLKIKPIVHMFGHMHEHQGKDMLGSTILLSPGYAHDGKYAIMDLDEKKGYVKLSFVRR